MIDLYERASNELDHETSDAIDLWIYESKNTKIISYLNEKIIKGDIVNQYLLNKYKEWLMYLKQKH